MAAVLACGPDAGLSHRSAAALWGMRGQASGAIEVTVPRRYSARGSIQRHYARLPADEVAVEQGIPVTTVPRTIFDLAGVLPVGAVEQMLRQAERLRLHDALSLADLLERYPGRRGAPAVRECLRRRELPGGVAREELEARFLAFLERRGLPRPRLNAWIELAGWRFQADFLWARERVIAELDGRGSHDTWSAFESDRDRDRRLAAAGYRTVRVTWHHLHEIPDEVEADLRSMLGCLESGGA